MENFENKISNSKIPRKYQGVSLKKIKLKKKINILEKKSLSENFWKDQSKVKKM